ncbi:DNA translocase FtsK 4TM domain-containing protein [Acinetobacter sp. C_4_1]|uniref:DNA translocase FtsK n=1 Tax=unclassified Acinetobacter TaxID=196816 RepID=UPI0021B7F015|nr:MULTISPECIES: DNA translocase FtsK [unclassified Acinetobacter]MCT8089735.1 DNA translocase FtsK 4TM domain-containing protein [Acinetobacter sp. F_3_1]MCT8097932.1 DNA translocase FtsK 4TM domain-containing protein [Acinetobacter sp. C_3_1]MCT8101335.1 DNA translocase FtsK 4TM domain-containing protein [Acinetobacter sp. C_4_1]MCT8135408.1 DNA translocase FtsK 4TM domain-containing protein [Acinetobacter sp. T_3_1]
MTAVSSVYAQRLIKTLFLVSFGIYLFLATVTYTPFDPGWMHISSDTQQVSNASGVAGAWIADLLFGFLGWASLLIPIFLFVEAIQVWWPYSFLNKPFRYAAQFFILLATASLLYLYWQVPADTLDNSSGGIIGYELGQSLTQILTIYGATLFLLLFWFVLFTFAFGVKWNKTWDTLRATPAYLQDLFYKNVPEAESAFDRTNPEVKKSLLNNKQKTATEKVSVVAEHKEVELSPIVRDPAAERLFNDMVEREQSAQQQLMDDEDEAEFEQILEKAHRLEQNTQRVVATGEVWRALHSDDNQKHKQDIDALLKAAEESGPHTPHDHLQAFVHEQPVATTPQTSKQNLDWDDDEIFDELLAAVPGGKTATDVHTPFNPVNPEPAAVIHEEKMVAAASVNIAASPQLNSTSKNSALDDEFDELDDLLVDDLPVDNLRVDNLQVDHLEPAAPVARTTSSYAQSSAFVRAEINTQLQSQSTISEDEKALIASNKDAFREVWQETAGKPVDEFELDEDDFDLDAPLTDAMGRPMSRAMQVAQNRRDLPPLPGLELLDEVDPNKKVNFTAEQLARLSELLEIKLQEFNVKAKVIEAQPGPVVTRFELDLAPGVKASKVTNISRDLARSMSMASVRVVEVIPGKPYIGIEVPNSSREMVRLIELVKTPKFEDPNGILSMAMGKDISGNPVITELGKAPHMLVAGTTGSGKSVAVNSMILSMLLKYTPDQLRLILIDPKQLELANYNDIPHLLTPVVTDMKDAVSALNWCVNEMERRYKLMSFLKIRKLSDYNRKVEEAIANGEDLFDPTWKASESVAGERAPRLTPLPSIVIVADEFADMIMQVGKKAEEMITRLAQKSRAAGIHLLLATQRPSVDVITGLIKANIPTRVALRVNSKIDSRTILDAGGAEDLLGHGDMLFLGPGKIEPERVHGAFIADDEVNRICDAWRERGEPNYVDEILTPYDEEPTSRGFEEGDGGSDRDALYDQCVSFVLETRKASTSSLQRKFSLGYNRAARIIDQMEENGIVSGMGANGKRDILI